MNDWEIAGSKNGWVCPSDRHLALKAKLKSGWSSRTVGRSPMATARDSPKLITDYEMQQIEHVLKRAERSRLREAVRVGKLVERLDSMKRRTVGNGQSQCLLCGADFGMLASRSYGAMCAHCKKFVCQKNCGVEQMDPSSTNGANMFLCKICSEQRQMWRKSNAWFYKHLPDFVAGDSGAVDPSHLHPSELSSMNSHQSSPRGSWTAADIRLSSDLPDEEDTHSNASSSLHKHRWGSVKSSASSAGGGGWPSLNANQKHPNRVKPKPNTAKLASRPSPRWVNESKSKTAGVVNDARRPSSSDDDLYKNEPLSPTKSESPPARPKMSVTSSVLQSLPIKRISIARRKHFDDSESEEEMGVTAPTIETVTNNQSLTHKHSDDHSQQSGDSGVVATSHVKAPIKQRSVVSENVVLSGPDVLQDRPLTQQTSVDQPTVHVNSSFGNSSLVGHTNDLQSSPDEDEPTLDYSSYKGFLRDRGAEGSMRMLNVPPVVPPIAPANKDALGQLDFSLKYDSDQQLLEVFVEKAKALKAMDSNGLSDPFVKLTLLPGATKSSQLRTKTCYKTLNPVWEEQHVYHGMNEDDLNKKVLRLLVLDEDRFGADFLGETRFPLRKLLIDREKHLSVFLEKQIPIDERSSLAELEINRGKILLSLGYDLGKGQLFVSVIRCAQLTGMDTSGYSDPYVRIMLTPLTSKKHKSKTVVKKRTCNPEFNEDFAFTISAKDLTEKSLEIGVFDKDIGSTDDYIGGTILGANAKGDRLKHWQSVLKSPGERFQGWHRLQPDTNATGHKKQ